MSTENIVKEKPEISSDPAKFLDELKTAKQKSAEFSALMGHLSNITPTSKTSSLLPKRGAF